MARTDALTAKETTTPISDVQTKDKGGVRRYRLACESAYLLAHAPNEVVGCVDHDLADRLVLVHAKRPRALHDELFLHLIHVKIQRRTCRRRRPIILSEDVLPSAWQRSQRHDDSCSLLQLMMALGLRFGRFGPSKPLLLAVLGRAVILVLLEVRHPLLHRVNCLGVLLLRETRLAQDLLR